MPEGVEGHPDQAIEEDVGKDSTFTVAEPLSAARRQRSDAVLGTSKIDRFRIIRKLGEGGMGSVYAAFDTVLDRRIAVKVVRPDRKNVVDGVTARDRLLREAQAMARLSHPNVVAVLDVGDLGEDIYVALEYVDGMTLTSWLAERPRSWREIVATFREAGKGLVAAHEAGLVHRDFKPDNVMVSRDGRILVTDFGVVSMSGGASPVDGSEGASGAVSSVTYAGLRVGTLPYMAPEQHAGEPADVRADQFSFCVALWEALFGVRPFVGNNEAALEAAKRDGRIEPVTHVRVPRWLAPPLRRGLAARAGDRWPSLGALLGALANDPAVRRRRIAIAAAIGLVVAAAVTLALAGWARDTKPTCEGGC
jgi:serine/threonine protein kinase